MRRLRFSRQRKERLALIVGALAGALVIGGLLVASVTVQNGIPGNKGTQLDLEFRDVGNVNRYDDVRIAGRRVGGVAAISYGGGHATVRVRLSEGLGGLTEATQARVRLAGIVGAQYVELIPKRGGKPLHDGDTIPLSRTSTSPDVFAALTAFDRSGVRDLHRMVQALGVGLAGRGEGANRALATGPRLLDAADRILDAVGSDRPALRRLFPAAESFVGALVPVREEIAAGFDAGERSLRPFADNPRVVSALLRESAAAVRETPVELPRSRPLLHETVGLTHAITRLTANAPQALRESTRLLREAPAAMRTTTPMLRRLHAVEPPVVRLLHEVEPLIGPFGHSLDDALPPIEESSAHVCDYDESFPWLPSVTKFGASRTGPLGLNTFVRVLSGGDGFVGENLPADYQSAGYSAHDASPPPCKAAKEAYKP